MPESCICSVAGFCDRHKRIMGERMHSICNGTSGIPEESVEKYRQLFALPMPETPVSTATRPPKRTQTGKFDPIPRDQWPTAAVLVATLRTPEDSGVGDTIKRLIGTAGAVYQAAFRAVTGHSCTGCGFRQTKWNQLYPY